MPSSFTKSILAAGSAAVLLGLAGCASSGGYPASTPGRSGSLLSPSDMGQMGSRNTPQGETGTPHMHDPAAASTMGARGSASGLGGSSLLRPQDMGQMSSHGTPQGETGTPHMH